MPRVSREKLKIQPMHSRQRFGEGNYETKIVEQLNAIDVQIIQAPTVKQFRTTIATFLGNTWGDTIKTADQFSGYEVDQIIDECFAGELLPTAMETINITWSVNGMDMVDTTHLIRHRLFSFSAQVHGDRDIRTDRVVAKAGILASPYAERYKELCEEAMALYVDMMDSGEVHGLDARTVLPRCFEHFYFVRCTIKDLIGYCRMRGDEQIQTTVDNVIAMKLWLEILRIYPWLKPCVDFRREDDFYVRQCQKGKTNIFPPNEKNDVFDWHEDQFYHPKPRDEYPGGNVYKAIREQLLAEIDAIDCRHLDE